MERTQEYTDERKYQARANLKTVKKELTKLGIVKDSPNYKKHGLYVDVLDNNTIIFRASAFSESDPRNLNILESDKMIKALQLLMKKRKYELESVIND